MHRELPNFRARGAELHLVGNGSRHFAQAFREELDITCPLYVDTKLEAYRRNEITESKLTELAAMVDLDRKDVRAVLASMQLA